MNSLLIAVILLKRRKMMTGRFEDQRFDIESSYYLQFFTYTDYQFYSQFRVTKRCFESLFNVLIELSNGKSIKQEHLLIFLYKMAHGLGYRAIGSYFRVSASFAHSSFYKVAYCLVLHQDVFIKLPDESKMQTMASQFATKNNRYDIMGAMDGTYIRIARPTDFANCYYNRKGFFSIHMLAVCDWNMEFWYVQAGNPGNTHDSTAFIQSSLYRRIVDGSFGTNYGNIQYKLLTDSAFRRQAFIVKTNATQAHRERIMFDEYRGMSSESARTCIECIFGIMVNRWQIFQKRINDTTDRVKWIVVSGCCVHNYIQQWNRNNENDNEN